MKDKLLEKIAKFGADYVLLNSCDEFSREHGSHTELAKITGFSGTEGEALLDKSGKITLFVDPRYHITAENLANENLSVYKVQMGEKLTDAFSAIIPKKAKILINENIGLARFLRYTKCLKNYEITDCEEKSEYKTSILKYIGRNLENTRKRFEKIQKLYKQNYLITDLDKIAYALDLRGTDYDFKSCFEARLYLGEKSILFTNHKLPINFDFVEIQPLEKYNDFIKNQENTILIEEGSITLKDYSAINSPKLIKKDKLANLMGAKNADEIKHYKYAFSMLDKALASFRSKIELGMNELELKNIFEEELKKAGAYAPSFKTLLAIGENSASIHYSNYDKNKKLQKNDVVLLDCGGFWDLGYATDITRVFAPFGASEKAKKVYTMVLKANLKSYISGSSSPYELDKIARDYLESVAPEGFDFSHSLGHGIGQNVHQAPPTLSPMADKKFKLKPNMTFTIEPGLYKEGEFGIRLENSCYLDKNGKIQSFSKFPYEKNLIDFDMLDKKELEALEEWGLNE
ncbi:aminopeptidase P family protein [bacterium]|nr:aminopeptidase P family protein [bacterium]